MGMIQTSTEADLLVEFSQWGTLLHTIIDGFHSDAILLKRFPLEDPNEITKDWLSPAFDPISLDTFPAEVIERIAENMSEINQKSRSRRRVRIIFRRKSQNSKVKKSRLEEEIEEETKYLDGPHSTVTCNKGQIFPSLISAIRTSSNWITSICLANVKVINTERFGTYFKLFVSSYSLWLAVCHN